MFRYGATPSHLSFQDKQVQAEHQTDSCTLRMTVCPALMMIALIITSTMMIFIITTSSTVFLV